MHKDRSKRPHLDKVAERIDYAFAIQEVRHRVDLTRAAEDELPEQLRIDVGVDPFAVGKQTDLLKV
ncbi:hypothetical protein BCR34DRAFT_556960 [Clohesyomyces aquaticus]|uniref:Uncharacterized protein n=1 Tax=Clohesyomyces aquaticus TaxID=1231657 RepID=A0A1Y2A2T6_9PLEO|nr:hypothetical protein BCR34DRAFT_556960 [Clohesyomyces aquaticus]